MYCKWFLIHMVSALSGQGTVPIVLINYSYSVVQIHLHAGRCRQHDKHSDVHAPIRENLLLTLQKRRVGLSMQ